jgi:hypothetical protein
VRSLSSHGSTGELTAAWCLYCRTNACCCATVKVHVPHGACPSSMPLPAYAEPDMFAVMPLLLLWRLPIPTST